MAHSKVYQSYQVNEKNEVVSICHQCEIWEFHYFNSLLALKTNTDEIINLHINTNVWGYMLFPLMWLLHWPLWDTDICPPVWKWQGEHLPPILSGGGGGRRPSCHFHTGVGQMSVSPHQPPPPMPFLSYSSRHPLLKKKSFFFLSPPSAPLGWRVTVGASVARGLPALALCAPFQNTYF